MIQFDYKARAEQLWQEFDERDRDAVQFGMIPLHRMHEALAEGYESGELWEILKDIARREDDQQNQTTI